MSHESTNPTNTIFLKMGLAFVHLILDLGKYEQPDL